MFCLPTRAGRRSGAPASEMEILFCEIGRRIEVNDRIVRKKIAVGVEFEVVAGLVKQHLLGVFQMLLHRQFGRVRIFANQRFKNLVVVVAPVIHGA